MPDLNVVEFRTARAPRLRRPDPSRHVIELLIHSGDLSSDDHTMALALQQREDISLIDLLLSHEWITEAALAQAQSQVWRTSTIDLTEHPPDATISGLIDPRLCLQHGMLPWRHVGGATVFLTADPAGFENFQQKLPPDIGPIRLAVAQKSDIRRAILRLHGPQMVSLAEHRVFPQASCRFWTLPRSAAYGGAALALTGLFLLPELLLSILFLWALFTLFLLTGLKLTATLMQFRSALRPLSRDPPPTIARLPMVSIMVPLFKERKIAGQLLKNLEKIDYPTELTDILLIVEAVDDTTKQTLARTTLPAWINVVEVPPGQIQTKPRALNYALDFCRGSIIGVYDAEDIPDPSQLHAVVRRFHERGPEVACLQGVLDFYNSRTNWLSRCFTIEYAAWFRLLLPGLVRLGMVIPLGGTTLFFRRAALENLGGWDAHNVTEDADLGVRLARQGYRAETINTTTREEANCRTLPWIKQRSRWIKGYMITYCVHMRNPIKLWRDLGARKFWGMHILFAGSLSQVLLAPLLWSCWLMFFGLPHPLTDVMPALVLWVGILLFLISEVISIAIGVTAVHRKGDKGLAKWVPTLHFYHPLAAFAAYKGLFELFGNPFYWDKTEHGAHPATATPPPHQS